MSTRAYRVRELEYDDPGDAVKMTTSWGTYAEDDTASREDVAERFVEERYSDREYYGRGNDGIRVGVRPADCKGCGGYGIMEAGGEDCPTCDGGADPPPGGGCSTCHGRGALPHREEPCSRCSELVFVVEVELTPSCSAYVESFDHPLEPPRCYDCGERMDNGANHDIDRERPVGDHFAFQRRCMIKTPTNPEVIDHDRNPDGRT